MSDELEPDAWKWRDKVGVNQATLTDPEEPLHDYSDMHGKKPLFSAETIRQEIGRGKNMLEVTCGKCGFNGWIDRQITDGDDFYCSSCGYENPTAHQEVSLVNATELRKRFSESNSTTTDEGDSTD